jgi:hypothetical protein
MAIELEDQSDHGQRCLPVVTFSSSPDMAPFISYGDITEVSVFQCLGGFR